MTDAECAEVLAEFRGLTLGPRLSEALDHAIRERRMLALLPRQFVDKRGGIDVEKALHEAVLMNWQAA